MIPSFNLIILKSMFTVPWSIISFVLYFRKKWFRKESSILFYVHYNRRLVVKLKNVKPEYLNVKKEDNP